MFKDYHKYLSTSLRVYLFVLVIVFILKIVGLDYFGLDYNSELINFLDQKMNIPIVNTIIQFALLSFQLYCFTYIATKKKPKLIEIIIVTCINVFSSYLIFKYEINYIYSIVSTSILFIYFMIKKVKIKRIIKVLVIITILEAISNITRNSSFVEYSFTISIMLNIDYMLMLLIYCQIIKEGKELCQHHGFYLPKKIHLSTLLKELQRKLHSFKELDKENKIATVIYIILSLIWNIGTLIIILLVAKLNDTFIECIFILTSFWLSKGAFGKPFHLPSMIHCFIVSNLSYYILNRITTPLGISMLIPIMLGVGLSYVTSKLVKKTYKPLYRGMPEDLFNETILKLVDKDSDKYKICYEFYINKESDLSLSFKYKYSVPGIRKIKDRINEKIKRLNQ